MRVAVFLPKALGLLWLVHDRDHYHRLSATIEFNGETIVEEGFANCPKPSPLTEIIGSLRVFIPATSTYRCSNTRIGLALPGGPACIGAAETDRVSRCGNSPHLCRLE
jgi:hypothetical protein